MLRSIGLPELVVILGILVSTAIVPFWKIFQKAGFPGILSLLMLVPFANLITLWVVAFTEWPALRRHPVDR